MYLKLKASINKSHYHRYEALQSSASNLLTWFFCFSFLSQKTSEWCHHYAAVTNETVPKIQMKLHWETVLKQRVASIKPNKLFNCGKQRLLSLNGVEIIELRPLLCANCQKARQILKDKNIATSEIQATLPFSMPVAVARSGKKVEKSNPIFF